MTPARMTLTPRALIGGVVIEAALIAAGVALWTATDEVVFVVAGFGIGALLAMAYAVSASRRDPSDMGRTEVDL